MNYVKGTYVKNIYSNIDNGYVVGVLKIKETDLDINTSTIYFTGSFYDLKLKNNYTMYGELVDHQKYGLQFSVTNYEILLPTKKEELIEFLSSDIFPIGEKTAKVAKLIPEIDEKINAVAKGWKTQRMGKADLSILRLAVYEMQYDEEIPVNVAINEAVELAKKFGSDDSPAFVNGILAKLV